MDNFSRRFRRAMSRTSDRPLASDVTGIAFVIGLNVPALFVRSTRDFRSIHLLMMPPLPFLNRPASVACQNLWSTAIPAMHRSAPTEPDGTRPDEQPQESTDGTRIPPGRDGS